MNGLVNLDSLDYSILSALTLDGRKSFSDLSEEFKVSVGTIRNRYNRLIDTGILHIIGWTDPPKAGFNAYARVMIDVKPSQLIREIADKLLLIKEVSFIALTSGKFDLEINILCKDNKQLLDIMNNQIHSMEGVFETNTTVYFEVLKWASHDVGNLIEDAENK
jgi:Lrp/AsnC family transcriptional regulator for asnA, asnC and gidA